MQPSNFEEKRKYRRFADRSFASMTILLDPVPPLYGEPASGAIIDLSAGGMAIILSELIPKKMMMRMKLTFKDGSTVESVVLVRRAYPKSHGGAYIHGLEFLNLSPEDVERLEGMAADCLDCDNRVKQAAPEICKSGCRFSPLCLRAQRRGGAKEPATVEFVNLDEAESIAHLRAKFDEVTKKHA